MLESEWWLRPGELIWTDEIEDHIWQATFLWDDGALWGLRAALSETVDSDPNTPNVWWDFDASSLLLKEPHIHWPNGFGHGLSQTLRRRMPHPLGALRVEHQQILNTVASHLHQGATISGKRLRSSLGKMPVEQKRDLIRALYPRYLREGDDHFALTLAGFLASDDAAQLRSIVELGIAAMRAKFEDDPDFTVVEWGDLRGRAGWDEDRQALAWACLDALQWINGGSGPGPHGFSAGVPRDLEEIISCRTFDDYLRYLQGGRARRSWPTAPERLEGDESSSTPRTDPEQDVLDIEMLWGAIETIAPSLPDLPHLSFNIPLMTLWSLLRTKGLAFTPGVLLGALSDERITRTSPWRVSYDPSAGDLRFSVRRSTEVAPERRPELSEAPPIQIYQTRLTETRLFTECVFDFSRPTRENETGQWILVLGENGAGKTTLLQCLALGFVDQALRDAVLANMQPGAGLVRRGSEAATVEVVSSIGSWAFSVVAGSKKEASQGESSRQAVFVVGYGSRRGSAVGGPAREVSFAAADDIASLFDEHAGLIHAETWLRQQRLASNESEPAGRFYHSLIATLCALLPEVEDLEVSGEAVLARFESGIRVNLRALSDGYLTMLGWVLDMVARWAHMARQQWPESLDGAFAGRMTGVVLVDEIDLHLHPRWQRDVVAHLRRAFPRISFIVTTHSPLTVLGAREGEVHVLARTPGDERPTVRRFDGPRGARADQILTGPYFGLSSTLDAETLVLLEQYRMAKREGRPSEADHLRASLRKRLDDFEDTSVERLALDVAQEFFTEAIGRTSEDDRRRARELIAHRLRERRKSKEDE